MGCEGLNKRGATVLDWILTFAVIFSLFLVPGIIMILIGVVVFLWVPWLSLALFTLGSAFVISGLTGRNVKDLINNSQQSCLEQLELIGRSKSVKKIEKHPKKTTFLNSHIGSRKRVYSWLRPRISLKKTKHLVLIALLLLMCYIYPHHSAINDPLWSPLYFGILIIAIYLLFLLI